jgi:mediator of RNA polymerase II transcription subunit 13
MEFLKSCQTNAQAIVRIFQPCTTSSYVDMWQGDFEAVAFQALSVARNSPHTPRSHDWIPSDDIRDAEAELRRDHHLVLSDASRPWLWLFRATTVDPASQPPLELPTLEGFRFHRTVPIAFVHVSAC